MFIVAIVSWIAGVAAYSVTLLLVYGERLSWGGDAKAVLFWSSVSFALVFLLLYLPVLRALRRRLRGVRPRWPFPLSASALGVVPTALIAVFNGGDLSSLLSEEARLFLVMFGVIGLVVGIGFARVHRDDASRS